MKAWLFIVLVFLVISNSLWAQTKEFEHRKWTKEIEKKRKELNAYYKSEASPLKIEHRKIFKSHEFYAPDSSFKVVAQLTKVDNSPAINIPTTTTRMAKYRVYGTAHFFINGNPVTLELYEPLERTVGVSPYLFLPFKDATSGEETYEGGRYLDLPIPKEDRIVIDFNKAYYPYCAYNEKYSCPLVPSANYLSIPITAGIKGFPIH